MTKGSRELLRFSTSHEVHAARVDSPKAKALHIARMQRILPLKAIP